MPETMEKDAPRFADARIELDLSGEQGNIFAVMGHAKKAIRENGGTEEQVREYVDAVTSSASYEAALKVTREWVTLVDLT